jgi:hypothetical protein
MDLTENHKKRGQDYKGDVAQPQFSVALNKLEQRLTDAQVNYHVRM